MKPYPDITLPIVGVDHPNPKRGPTRRFGVSLCRPGDRIELRPEPKNPFDEHAVAVFNDLGMQIGYLPSARAVWISQLFRQGVDIVAAFQSPSASGGFIRLSFDGSAPDLPPDHGDEGSPEWWPDLEYPDD